MNIKGITSNNVISLYNHNKNRIAHKGEMGNSSDRIEISDLGKRLTTYNLEGVKIDDSLRLEAIKSQVEQGTYNVDAKLTAKSILDNIKGRGI